jgi:hypothetical protein
VILRSRGKFLSVARPLHSGRVMLTVTTVMSPCTGFMSCAIMKAHCPVCVPSRGDVQTVSFARCARSGGLCSERRPGLIWRRQAYRPRRPPPPREGRWTPGPSGCSGNSEIQAAILNVPGSRYVVSSKDSRVAGGSCYCPGTIRSEPRSLKY